MPSPCHFHRGKLQHSEGSCRRSFPLKYFPCPVRANEVPPVVPRQYFVLRFSVGWAPRSVTNAINAKRVSCHLGCLPPCHAVRTRLYRNNESFFAALHESALGQKQTWAGGVGAICRALCHTRLPTECATSTRPQWGVFCRGCIDEAARFPYWSRCGRMPSGGPCSKAGTPPAY